MKQTTPVIPLSVAFVALANAIVQTLSEFGLALTQGQQNAIGVVVNAFVLAAVALSHFLRAWRADRERWSHMNGL